MDEALDKAMREYLAKVRQEYREKIEVKLPKVIVGNEVRSEFLGASFDSIKVNVVVTDKPVTMLGDEPGALDRFRRVFATWDFRNGA